jgi:hypothetical protein
LAAVVSAATAREGGNMSKKNNLAKRKKQYEFDLQSATSLLLPPLLSLSNFDRRLGEDSWSNLVLGIDIAGVQGRRRPRRSRPRSCKPRNPR